MQKKNKKKMIMSSKIVMRTTLAMANDTDNDIDGSFSFSAGGLICSRERYYFLCVFCSFVVFLISLFSLSSGRIKSPLQYVSSFLFVLFVSFTVHVYSCPVICEMVVPVLVLVLVVAKVIL